MYFVPKVHKHAQTACLAFRPLSCLHNLRKRRERSLDSMFPRPSGQVVEIDKQILN